VNRGPGLHTDGLSSDEDKSTPRIVL